MENLPISVIYRFLYLTNGIYKSDALHRQSNFSNLSSYLLPRITYDYLVHQRRSQSVAGLMLVAVNENCGIIKNDKMEEKERNILLGFVTHAQVTEQNSL